MNEISVSLLKIHPKNGEYFSLPAPEEKEALKRSIAAEGIRDPLKVTPDYTVIAGHVRLEIAKELGLEKVPVVIVDGDPEYLEYLLIADNEERRICSDPIKKAKRAEFLKRYWGVRQGKKPQNAVESSGKTIGDVAKAIGESVDSTQRLLKLNDLIPELQQLVSESKLSQTAAYSLAFLPPNEQKELLASLGESGVCGLSVREAQELRKELDAFRKEKESLQNRLVELEEEKESLSRQLADLQDSLSSVEEEVAEKLGRQYEEKLQEALSGLQKRLREAKEESEYLRAKLRELKQNPVEKVVEKVVYQTDPSLEAELKSLKEQLASLKKERSELKSKLEETYRTLNNYLEANAHLKGHNITDETKFRSSVTMAAKTIGEAVARVKIDFKPSFRRNKDLTDRLHLLAEHLEEAARELRELAEDGMLDAEVVGVESAGVN